MTAGTDVYYCSDRSSAYEIQKLLQGGSDLCRDLLLYGTPEPEDVNYAKKHLFPVPLGGLEGATPDTGWTFVQIPGMDKYLKSMILQNLAVQTMPRCLSGRDLFTNFLKA